MEKNYDPVAREDTRRAAEYMIDTAKKGYSKKDIINKLIEAGYSEETVESASHHIRKENRRNTFMTIVAILFLIIAYICLLKGLNIL